MSPRQIDAAREKDRKRAESQEENIPKPPEFYKDENGIDRLKAEDNIDRTSFCKRDTHEYHTMDSADGAKLWCNPQQQLNHPRQVCTMDQKRKLAREIMKTFTEHGRRRRPFDLAIISGHSFIFEDLRNYRQSVANFLENRGYEYVEIYDIVLGKETFKSSLFDVRESFFDCCFWVVDRKEITTLREDCFRLSYDWRSGFIFKSEFESCAVGIRGYDTENPCNQVYLTEVMIEYDMFSNGRFNIYHNDDEIKYGKFEMGLEDIERELAI